MIKGLFINAAILVSFLFISGQCFRENELHPNAPFRIRLLAGIIAGVVGSVLMFFSIPISSTFILDFRQLALMVVSIYGGIYSSVIAGLIIGFARLILFGFSTTSLVGFITAVIVSIGCGLISQMHIEEKKKWTYMLSYCMLVSLVVYYILLKEIYLLIKIFAPYGLGMCILVVIMYYFTQYIATSNKLIRRLKEESSKDYLTGVNNVRNFDLLFNKAIEAVKQNGESISILMIDIDFFKKINDTYGHLSGDAILKEIALLITKNSRSFDIVSRNGGEEFSVILLDCSVNRAKEIGERIRKAIELHTFVLADGKETHVTVSIGVSTYPDTTTEIETLMSRADSALYRAKESGRNRVCS